ncbi:hypothetical protein BU23DRAFT_567343 [Bimuria novae-zelandiae CBS 107.79]|uniref:Uncharacterized protein n=1 Tax=Bimuria novae-zelandiae CBS 107.79 TaxID=1447943 RepID=A0A6A5VHK8_9PLEO|nr:hypothetical protein BU23DRAFT_567343 [Bimuria novae-zelandiae CBS 107.79]
MKLQILIGLLSALSALAAPVAKAGVEGTDTSNLVLSGIAVAVTASDEDFKVKRSASPGVAGTDTSNLVLSGIAVAVTASDEDFKKIKRSAETNLASTGIHNVVKRAEDAPDGGVVPIGLLLLVAKADDDGKRDAKLINPYIDDVEKADKHAVLGE